MDEHHEQRAHRAQDIAVGLFKILNEARGAEARSALQSALLINGGAATAILAFVGSLATRSPAAHVPRALIWSLCLFALGVSAAAVSGTSSHLAYHHYAQATAGQKFDYQPPYVTDGPTCGYHRKLAAWFFRTGLCANVVALICFILGIGAAVEGFVKIP